MRVAAHICQHGQIPLDRGQKLTSPAQGVRQLVAAHAAPLGADAAPPGANTAQAVRGCDSSSVPEGCGLLPTFCQHGQIPLDRGQNWTEPAQGVRQLVAAYAAPLSARGGPGSK